MRYLVRRRWYALFWAATGFTLGLILVALIPPVYEASFDAILPTSNAINAQGQIEPSKIITVPPALDIKKQLLRPEQFSVATLANCGLSDSNTERKALISSISTNVVNYGSSALVTVRIVGRTQVEKCARALLNDVLQFTNGKKNDYVAYVKNINSPDVFIFNQDGRLSAEIRISDRPVYPRNLHWIVGCTLLGLLLAFFWDWLRWQYNLSQQHRREVK